MKLITLAITFFLVICANAQWTFVNLHPAGASYSEAYGVEGAQQVGYARVNDEDCAAVWSGSGGTFVNLNPAWATSSRALAVSGSQQVGYAGTDFDNQQASLWTGSAASWVDLHPSWANFSGARGVGGGQQVGFAGLDIFVGDTRAILWTGTAASWVSLHPASAIWSEANGTDGSQQVGQTAIGGATRASLWTGTAASWVDLHPAMSSYSNAFGVSDGQQAGSARFGANHRAGIWTGTAASWVDLHPPTAEYSFASGTNSGRQAGVAYVDSVPRASFWSGMASSWVDLGSFMPLTFSGHSIAHAVWRNGATVCVVGTAVDTTLSEWVAVMWVTREVGPTSYNLDRGNLFSGNLASLLNGDDNRLVVRPGFVFSISEPPVQVRLNSTAPTSSPNGFSFSVESSASFGNAQQKIGLWNFTMGEYEFLDTRVATTTDTTATVTVRTNPSRFIQPGALAIRALVSYRAIGPAFGYPWSGRIDRAWWNFPG